MKRAITIALACAVGMALPASAVAGNGNSNTKGQTKKLAAKHCKDANKADNGAFKAVWGKNAMRDCKHAARSEVRNLRSNAAHECRDERELGVEDFQAEYGTNGKEGTNGYKRNAFGMCVSGKVRAEINDGVEAFANAARQCRDERSEIGVEEFQKQYGSSSKAEQAKGGKRFAFGKCVSSKAKNGDEGETNNG